MEIRLLRIRDKWADAPARWARQYKGTQDAGKQQIMNALAALSPGDLEGDRIEAIIGNTSWTRQSCDICGLDKDTLCHLGEEPDYEARWVEVCLSCLKLAIDKFEQSQ